MFNLNTASSNLRKVVKIKFGIGSGKWEPVSENPNRVGSNKVVAKVYNRNHPNGVQVTQWDIDYAEAYL